MVVDNLEYTFRSGQAGRHHAYLRPALDHIVDKFKPERILRWWPQAVVACRSAKTERESGGIEARTGLRMMPTSPRSPLSFRTADFPQYGWKAGLSGGAFPSPDQLKPAPGMR